jgi:hypothetical protein
VSEGLLGKPRPKLTGHILLQNVEILVDRVKECLRVFIRDENLPRSCWNRLDCGCEPLEDVSMSHTRLGGRIQP